MPIHSPLLCTAIYAKKYMNITDKLAFISPCIAKKAEIKALSQSSREMADESDINRTEIVKAIKLLMDEAVELTNSITDINKRLTNLAACTEEICAEADVVKNISYNVKEKLQELNQHE